ncbi:MAG TPA: acyloxyacyl hydrolase [Burkholderiaceae bacterium]|nr:acyloxyacyl hydrolase [Burkholderiaceae bacterium]
MIRPAGIIVFSRCSRMLCIAAFAACVLAGGPARAQPSGAAAAAAPAPVQAPAGAWSLRLGYNSDYRKIGLMYETPTWWSSSPGALGRLDLGAELGVSYWDAENGQPDSMWQFSATPMLRWWPTEVFYAEIGVGVTALTRTHFADRDLGSAFQFGNHVGAGVLINDAHRIGVRYSHFSNAGLKEPNQGLDLLQLTYTYRF